MLQKWNNCAQSHCFEQLSARCAPIPKKKATPSSNGAKSRFSVSPMWKLEGVGVENGTYVTNMPFLENGWADLRATCAKWKRRRKAAVKNTHRFSIRCLVFEIYAIKVGKFGQNMVKRLTFSEKMFTTLPLESWWWNHIYSTLFCIKLHHFPLSNDTNWHSFLHSDPK